MLKVCVESDMPNTISKFTLKAQWQKGFFPGAGPAYKWFVLPMGRAIRVKITG